MAALLNCFNAQVAAISLTPPNTSFLYRKELRPAMNVIIFFAVIAAPLANFAILLLTHPVQPAADDPLCFAKRVKKFILTAFLFPRWFLYVSLF
jgi:hypothetical protein